MGATNTRTPYLQVDVHLVTSHNSNSPNRHFRILREQGREARGSPCIVRVFRVTCWTLQEPWTPGQLVSHAQGDNERLSNVAGVSTATAQMPRQSPTGPHGAEPHGAPPTGHPPRGRAERKQETGFSVSLGRRPESEAAPDPGPGELGFTPGGLGDDGEEARSRAWGVVREASPLPRRRDPTLTPPRRGRGEQSEETGGKQARVRRPDARRWRGQARAFSS